MEDNARVFKDAYRTCRREYDSLAKKYGSVKSGASLQGMLKWMAPVLAAVALAFAAVYVFIPQVRPYALCVFLCVEVGLITGFVAYVAYSLLSGKAAKDSKRMARIEGILAELDEAWLANDANEAAKRRITAERQERQAAQYSTRERVLSNTQKISLIDEGEDQ